MLARGARSWKFFGLPLVFVWAVRPVGPAECRVVRYFIA